MNCPHSDIRIFLADFCISVLDTFLFSWYNAPHIEKTL